MSSDEELTRIAAVARGGSGRTPLYRWLRARHDDFAALVDENRPSWKALAEGFAGLGLKASGGRALTGETVRRTWWRVQRDVVAARARRGAVAPPQVVVPLARPAPAASSPPPPPAASTTAPGGAEAALARLRAEMDIRSGRKPNG
ncbi:hypothetical protein [Roseicella aerolata]|uniref:Uncharacterized protein n=1 Tax=Roseicella aerolata TaxID=2883479 RepID=A0A9X1LDE5_9PROT|nr:hypothetical protein [Roseicella aerolata]MCB4824677.1 hypothetical protein [Roseicella aerolata]